MNDELGKRMKAQYEDRTRFYLPRRTYIIVRVDGKAFHTLTKKCIKPFDRNFMMAMSTATLNTAKEMQNLQFAYYQSDEASFLMTDFAEITTEAWFDNNLQKITSVTAGLMTAYFMKAYDRSLTAEQIASFDARTFTIPDREEVINYFIWRQKDAIRNSIQMLAQSLYSHRELNKKSAADLHEMCFQKGKNWNNLSPYEKRGGLIVRRPGVGVEVITACPDFVQERQALSRLVPTYLG